MQQRYMTEQEEDQYLQTMLAQIAAYNPDQIVAVARSGCVLAQWAAELLDLPLGFYDHNSKEIILQNTSKRVVFVDDNCVSGETYRDLKQWFAAHYPDREMKLAVFFSDAAKTPQAIQQEIIQGTVLDYFALGPVFGSLKQYKGMYRRRRDGQNFDITS